MLQRDAKVVPGNRVVGRNRDEGLELLLGFAPMILGQRDRRTGPVKVGAILEAHGSCNAAGREFRSLSSRWMDVVTRRAPAVGIEPASLWSRTLAIVVRLFVGLVHQAWDKRLFRDEQDPKANLKYATSGG